ncbi:MAG: hypothetical protein ACP5EP_03740 [Acidobacteriaceae bacterium]
MEAKTEVEAGRSLEALAVTLERLAGAASTLEQTVVRLEEQQAAISGQVQKIVATVEQGAEMPLTATAERVAELERKLREAELQIAVLQAQAAPVPATGRKTVSSATVTLLAKQGISNLEAIEAGALDNALQGLSMEQRIAVKAQLFRAGLLS